MTKTTLDYLAEQTAHNIVSTWSDSIKDGENPFERVKKIIRTALELANED